MTCFSMQIGIALLLFIGGAIALALAIGIASTSIWVLEKLNEVVSRTAPRVSSGLKTVIGWVLIGSVACFVGYGFWLGAGDVMRSYFHLCAGG